jgi:hypothetical protein
MIWNVPIPTCLDNHESLSCFLNDLQRTLKRRGELRPDGLNERLLRAIEITGLNSNERSIRGNTEANSTVCSFGIHHAAESCQPLALQRQRALAFPFLRLFLMNHGPTLHGRQPSNDQLAGPLSCTEDLRRS